MPKRYIHTKTLYCKSKKGKIRQCGFLAKTYARINGKSYSKDKK